jgi:hypothetical protein
MKMKNFSIAIIMLLFSASILPATAVADSVMKAEFSSLQNCLAAIKKNTGQKLEIVTDKPNEVSGFLSNKKGFACEKKVTGTKGTYYEGWFMVDD